MELKYRLLNHPFYKSWANGEISMKQLSKYAASYAEFINNIPGYWAKVIMEFLPDSDKGQSIINEEIHHIKLWEEWTSKLEDCYDFPRMSDVIDSLEQMNPSELLGAIHAFEVQQPEISITKKHSLMQFYGFSHEDLNYFDDHMDEHIHISFGRMLYEKYADKADFLNGFYKGSELIYKGLDMYLEC